MTSDLSQMFNLRKTAAGSPRQPDAQPTDPPAGPQSADRGAEEVAGVESGVAFGETAGSEAETALEPPSRPRTRTTRAPTSKRTKQAAAKQVAARRAASAPPSESPAAAAVDASTGTYLVANAPVGEGSRRSATSSGGRASIMLYTTQTVRERMREEAQRISLSYGQLALLCIESTIDELEEVFAARVGATSQLFSTDYKPRSRTGETRSANLNLHIARGDLDVVESLCQRFPGCRSRNDLLSTACALHLTGESDA